MKAVLLGLLAETSLHCGAGTDGGLVDLPVAREAATDYPYIPGSSLKGALRQWAVEAGLGTSECSRIFGEQESAGGILVADARLLLLPVRSLSSAYKWLTCPHLLERLNRDCIRASLAAIAPDLTVTQGEYVGTPSDGLPLFLEERQFTHSKNANLNDVAQPLSGLLPDGMTHAPTRNRLATQLVVLNNEDFVWFARNGLPINARNILDDEKKTSKNLWYEETLPPDTLLYTLVFERLEGTLDRIRSLLTSSPYIQVGGNETVGMGWLATRLIDAP